MADLLNIVNMNMPDVAKGLGKSDEFVEAVQKLTKIDTAKLTREQAEAVREVLSEPELKKYLDEATNPWIRRVVDEGSSNIFNNWDDINSYFSMGKALFNGKVIYRDILDQKGPLLYFIYGIAYLISHQDFFGLYIIEIFI